MKAFKQLYGTITLHCVAFPKHIPAFARLFPARLIFFIQPIDLT